MTRIIAREDLMLLHLNTHPITYFWHPPTGRFFSHSYYDGRSAPETDLYCQLLSEPSNPILEAYTAEGNCSPATTYPIPVWATWPLN